MRQGVTLAILSSGLPCRIGRVPKRAAVAPFSRSGSQVLKNQSHWILPGHLATLL